MKSTRDGFGDELLALGAENEKLVVLSADLAKATRTHAFGQAYPDRFIECGIAEANMIGIASGMSEHGYRVFMSSFGSFITGRYDIIRCSLAYPECPVVIVGTHSGLAIGKDGNTQMGLEDVNLMRGLPNMKIYQPSTYSEARVITRWLAGSGSDELAYMRIGRQPVPDDPVSAKKFFPGSTTRLRDGDDLTIAFSGCLAHIAMEVAEAFESTHSCGVLNFHTIKPIDGEELFQVCDAPIVVIEDHSIIGGLGSAIAEELSSMPTPTNSLLRIGIDDVFAESGAPDDLYEKHGLTVEGILARIKDEVVWF